MSAGQFDIAIQRYATYTLDITLSEGEGGDEQPFLLLDYEPRMQLRRSAADTEVLMDLTTENGRIQVLDPEAGEIRITLSDDETGNLGWSEAVYDLILKGPDTIRLLEGAASVKDGVTR